MKKTLQALMPHGAVTVVMKVLLTLAFHAAYPTVEIVAAIHAVLAIFALGFAWPIVWAVNYVRGLAAGYEARHESKA